MNTFFCILKLQQTIISESGQKNKANQDSLIREIADFELRQEKEVK